MFDIENWLFLLLFRFILPRFFELVHIHAMVILYPF